MWLLTPMHTHDLGYIDQHRLATQPATVLNTITRTTACITDDSVRHQLTNKRTRSTTTRCTQPRTRGVPFTGRTPQSQCCMIQTTQHFAKVRRKTEQDCRAVERLAGSIDVSSKEVAVMKERLAILVRRNHNSACWSHLHHSRYNSSIECSESLVLVKLNNQTPS